MARKQGFDATDAIVDGQGDRLLQVIGRTAAELASDEKLLEKAIPTSGFVANYVEWASKSTEAPRLFHLGCALSCVSAAVGKRAYIDVGHGRLYGNLYVGLVGSQGVTRKSTSIGIATRTLDAAFEGLVYEGDATPEALGQKVLSATPEKLLVADELSPLLGGPEYSKHIRKMLATLFYCPEKLEWSRMGKGDGCVYNPALSVLGGSTFSWLKDADPADLNGGLLSRFLWFVAGHDGRLMPIPPKPDQAVRNALVQDLHNLREALERDQRRMGLDEADPVAEAHSRLYCEIMGRGNKELEEGLGGFCSRLASDHAPKIGMLLTLAQDRQARRLSPEVYEDHVRPLTTLLERGMRTVVGVLGSDDKLFAKVQKVHRFILRQGSAGILRAKALRGTKLTSDEFEKCVKTLVESGLLRLQEEGSTVRMWASEDGQ